MYDKKITDGEAPVLEIWGYVEYSFIWGYVEYSFIWGYVEYSLVQSDLSGSSWESPIYRSNRTLWYIPCVQTNDIG